MKICCHLCLLIMSFCVCCVKHENENIKNDTNISNLSPDGSFINNNETIELPTSEEYLLEIIKNYAKSVMPEEIGREWIWEFQIEGNFTSSGNREIIAFYDSYSPAFTAAGISVAFCFICDSSGIIIENIIQIKYFTSEFKEKFEIETGLKDNEVLGRYIFFKNRIIGCVSDFNGNGIEELYLYSLSGIDLAPYFVEFDGTEFKNILDFNISPRADHSKITAVNQSEKIIIINHNIPLEAGAVLKVITNSYIWNPVIQRYEVLSSEIKYYRQEWNKALNKYDDYFEIEYVEIE